MPRKDYSDVLEKDPTKSKPMSQEEKLGRVKDKLGEADRRSLQNQVIQDEESLAHAKEYNKDAPEGVRERLNRNKMILQHDEDLNPKSGTEKDRLAARAREIEDVLKKEMPTKREMWPRPGSPESQQAVRHNLKFQNDRKDLCIEWQNIQKRLNPDDPNAQSLELIRPD
jgi:hypothetical protein